MSLVKIVTAESSDDVLACYPILSQLHEGLSEREFLDRHARLEKQGYQLALLNDDSVLKAVAGFRLGESLAWKKYLYVDDLVTEPNSRSQGYGERLLAWISDYARNAGRDQVHLDSRVTRHEAHKFYINHGFVQGGYHFHQHLNN